MDSFKSFSQSPQHCLKHNTYFPVYDRVFAPFRNKPITFVEVGVMYGGSLFMWRDFFGKDARIIGIDLNPEAKKWEKEGFEIFIGNQSDPAFWTSFFSTIGEVDILLDDGGHHYLQQIITCHCAFPNIKDGGVLLVEDTHTSYMKDYGAPDPHSFMDYAKNMINGINYRFSIFQDKFPSENTVYSIQFFESIVVFEIDRKLARLKSKPIRNAIPYPEMRDYSTAYTTTLIDGDWSKLFKYD